jgi:two-component system phosphate regulon response regulator OmpR
MAFHVVVIDDDLALQEFYRLFLEGEQYRVTILSPYTVSPASIAAIQSDLIILDLVLGGSYNGWSILQALLDAPQTATLPVILVTALPLTTLTVEQQKLVRQRNIPIILKPFDLDTLLGAIKALLPDAFPPPTG